MLVGLHIPLFLLSFEFSDARENIEEPILPLVGLEVVAGLCFLITIGKLQSIQPRKGVLAWIISIGAALRLLMWPSAPILEDDYYRYLWDGGVLAHGSNPYVHAPKEFHADAPGYDGLPANLQRLAEDSGTIVERINHPHLRSVYPPVAQAAFALAHWIYPWSLMAWKLVLLVFDLATLLLLLRLLKSLELPSWAIAVYWWNPLLIKEIYNSGHLDVIALPFVLGAVISANRKRFYIMAVLLALSVGAKIWPIILLPLFLRSTSPGNLKRFGVLTLFTLLTSAIFWPVLSAGFDDNSGFFAYGKTWEMNDALFTLITWGVRFILGGRGEDPDPAQVSLIVRIAAATLVLAWIGRILWRQIDDPADLCRRCLSILAVAFFLSPTQFPWYSLWMLPFLVVSPRLSLMSLTVFLPFYYLRFHLQARGNAELFDAGIVWFEFLPVLGSIAVEWLAERRRLKISGSFMKGVA